MLRRIYRWLSPGGLALLTLGKTAWTGTENSWLGVNVEMYWSHADAATYDRWLRAFGFEILRRRYIPEGDSGHELFLARKAAIGGRGNRPPSTPRVVLGRNRGK
jgi:hypothetical protein